MEPRSRHDRRHLAEARADLAQWLMKCPMPRPTVTWRVGIHSQLRDSAIDKASLLNLVTYTAGGCRCSISMPPQIAPRRGPISGSRSHGPPSEQRRYSNPSIGLLGHITGVAMNSDFADLVETELFPQLRLNRSYIHPG